MKISTNTLRFINKRYGSTGGAAENGVDTLVQKIGAQLGAVEEVIDFGARFKGVLIAKVVSCEPHPNADKLHVCKIDDGGMAKGVERDESGYVQVVCGAPNVRTGLLVAWLPPGSTVPSTFGDNEFKLEARNLRGIVSNGMLASPKELSLSDDHNGILEITDDIMPGTLFTEAYNLDGDHIIDIENKMFTHRPDCFGWIGVARELEGIQQRAYKSPDWYTLQPAFPDTRKADELKLEIRNEIPELVPRFTAIVLRDIKVGPSPVGMQVNLARAGLRPINNIVDFTNLYMLSTGQPLHAYDYDKVAARSKNEHATIVIRQPHGEETLVLLNGKTLTFDAKEHNDILIATDQQLIGLGGVMGGADTEVDEHTKNIILECATFDMYAIRRTSMKWGLFTDAVTRFTKGQSPLQNLAVLAKITEDIKRYAGGVIASAVIDDCHVSARALKSGSLHPPVTVSRDFINSRLGLNLSLAAMTKLLTNVEFSVEHEGENMVIAAPFWRTDIAIPEDIVEEIGRLYGYDHLPLVLPQRDLTPVQKDPMLVFKARVGDILAKAGANEVLTYSFVHGDLLDKVGQSRELAFRLSNALSPDLQYYRLSLTPSLLEKVHPNIKAGFDEFTLFEINKTHNLVHPPEGDEAPQEVQMISLVTVAGDKTAASYAGAAYYQARAYLDDLGKQLGVNFGYMPIKEELNFPVFQPYDITRSAVVHVHGEPLGIVGEFRQAVSKKLKLPQFTAGFDLGAEALLGHIQPANRYQQLLRFPSTEQDVCFKVAADTPYVALLDAVQDALAVQSNLKTTVKPVDIYQREDDNTHKQVTLRIILQHAERTLVTSEVNQVLAQVVTAVTAATHATRV